MNVIRSRSKRTDRVFSKAKHGMQILAEALLDSGVKGAQNCSRTTTVSLHSRHSSLAIPTIIRIVHIRAGIFATFPFMLRPPVS
jgi:hypothetical protein